MSHITTVGAGAIGGTVSALLARAGSAVTLVDADAAHVAALRADGLRLRGAAEIDVPADDAHGPAELTGPLDVVLLAVKSQHTEAAVAALAPACGPDTVVVVLQNGLGAERAAELLPGVPVLGALVNIAADVTAPGTIEFYGFGSLVLGELDGAMTDRVRALAQLLAPVGEVEVTDNLTGLLWLKLGFGAILAATALTNEPQLDVIAREHALVAALGTEVFEVARRHGIALPAHDALDPALFVPNPDWALLGPSIDAWVAFQRPHQKPHSGIWRDLAVRKRPTEVGAHLAPIFALADRYAVPVAHLRRLSTLIREAEEGRRDLSTANLAELSRVSATEPDKAQTR